MKGIAEITAKSHIVAIVVNVTDPATVVVGGERVIVGGTGVRVNAAQIRIQSQLVEVSQGGETVSSILT